MSEQLELMVDLLQAKKNGRSCRRSYTWCCCRWSWRWRWRWRSCKWRLRCRWSCYCFSEHFSTNRSITRFIFLTWRSHDLWLFPAVQTLQSLRTKLVCHECNIPDGDPGAKGGGVKWWESGCMGGGFHDRFLLPSVYFPFLLDLLHYNAAVFVWTLVSNMDVKAPPRPSNGPRVTVKLRYRWVQWEGRG